MPEEEITIAEALKTRDYSTGHFGKWHVGGLSKTVNQSEFPGGPTPYSPPWENGFDECFSTESMMPTYNPYYHVGGKYGTDDYRFVQKEPVEKGQISDGFRWRDYYWTGQGEFVDEWLEGDDSKLIMDRAIDFIGRNVKNSKSFLSVIWFHTPHTPVVAGNKHRNLYPNLSMEEQHWFGSISAMDEQIGRLRAELRRLGVADNTILWFCSDNGPSYIHDYNSAGNLRGKKATLFEGGIRVPAIIEWPAEFKSATVSNLLSSTSDIYSTILGICGIEMDQQPVLDGVNILSYLRKEVEERPGFIAFQSPLPNRLKKYEAEETKQFALIGNRYKILSMDDGNSYELFDLNEDPGESSNLAEKNSEIVNKMKTELNEWLNKCEKSVQGFDYY